MNVRRKRRLALERWRKARRYRKPILAAAIQAWSVLVDAARAAARAFADIARTISHAFYPEPRNAMSFIKRPSGLVVPEPKPDPPKERKLFTALIRRHDDMVMALAGLERRRAELVGVLRGGEGGGLCGTVGYLIAYIHHEELQFEERT